MSFSYKSTALELGNTVVLDYVDEIVVTNTDAATRYFQLFLGDTAVPADTAVPDFILAVPAGATVSYDPEGTRWSVGGSIAFCLSTTAATKTATGAVGWFNIRGA